MRFSRFARLCALFLLLGVFFSCKAVDAHERISLSTGWSYALSEDAAVAGVVEPLPDSALKDLTPYVPEKRGYIWLCKRFSVPDALSSVPLGVYLGRITFADETYLNGTYIGGEGRFPPHEFSAWNTARYYALPETALTDSSANENLLIIKIWVDGEGSIVSNPFIGLASEAKRACSYEAFWNSKINLVFAFLMLIIAGYHFLMWLKNRDDRENLRFALINLLSVLYLSVFYYADLPGVAGNPMPFLLFQKIFSSALPFLFPFLVTLFILSFLKETECRTLLYIRAAFAVVPIIIALFAPSYQVLRAMRWTQVFLVPPLMYVLYILIRAVYVRNPDAKALLIGFSPLVGSVLLDLIIHGVLKVYAFPYITSMGWQLVIITLLFILANRFANSRLQVEELNRNLEQKVKDRTAELEESNGKLSQANSQLEEKNALLADAQRKAERDLKLAAYVQNSFYSGSLPAFKDWDVAYTFRPAAGVSGDLYEFFHAGGCLQGVGLFDVSGHGIASGLVTMLAKTVIDRKFNEGLSLPFNRVMAGINEQLISAKGDIENYLTGVLLRMKGNRVEYLNAGHLKVFFRSGKNAKVAPIELKGSDASGGIIGMAGIEPEFKVIGFSVHAGDSILLYTDCLNEARNASAEEFGYTRIQESFVRAEGSSQQKLNAVIADFTAFTRGAEVKDDLTVIVLTYTGTEA